jgi:hypothetical protein
MKKENQVCGVEWKHNVVISEVVKALNYMTISMISFDLLDRMQYQFTILCTWTLKIVWTTWNMGYKVILDNFLIFYETGFLNCVCIKILWTIQINAAIETAFNSIFTSMLYIGWVADKLIVDSVQNYNFNLVMNWTFFKMECSFFLF